jgi:hypothetical protein
MNFPARRPLITSLRLIVVLAVLALGGCESLGIDPIASIGSVLKNFCRGQSNCSVHEPDRTRPNT